MKSHIFKRTFSTLALAGFAIPAAAADPSHWYLGAGLGESQADIAEEEIRADLLASGFTTSGFADEESDFGYKLFAGYQFNRYLAVEGGFFDLGKFDYTATTVPAGTYSGELEFQGFNVDLVGMMPFYERAAVFARIGAHHGETDVAFAGTGAVTVSTTDASESGTNYKFGVGLQYSVTDALDLRIEAERYRIDDAIGNDSDLDLLSAGFVYRFAGPAAAPAPRARTPVAPPAEEEPALVVVPLPAATEEYCSLLDIQFEINQDEIQREERERLEVVGTFLDKYPSTSAVIEGHTDNVGSDTANLQLSQRRAESVVDYLVSEYGIDRSRLVARGYGESRPIADNATEAGKRANRRIGTIIGCANDIEGLQPLAARMTLAMQIEFDTDDATIKREYHDQLAKVAKFLDENPTVTATMEGHADNASPGRAQEISRQRAQSVASYLVDEFGVSRSRLSVQGYGQTRRFNYNTSAEGRQENRRVNIILG
ncbi:MAG: OmpA family protein, partial [Woeseia sp.]